MDICEDHQKESKLARLLEEIGDGSKILVFVETKRKCDELTRSAIDMIIFIKHIDYIDVMITVQNICSSIGWRIYFKIIVRIYVSEYMCQNLCVRIYVRIYVSG